MICYVCGNNDWLKLDGVHSKMIMQICKPCGNLCHEVDCLKEKELLNFYRNTYRVVPNHQNLITTTNKLQYIFRFLNDFLKDKKNLNCLDIGAATGYLCNVLKQKGHNVSGTEYTTGFRRVSEHFYGIPLTEEIDETKKYDLITMYHVFEHMMQPDKKMEKYVGLLAENGHMFVGTPYWLDVLELQSGEPIHSPRWPNSQAIFDHLFHPNHINLFSKTALQNIFRKSGLTTVKDYFQGYGQEYLLRFGGKRPIEPEDYQRVKDIIMRQKQALNLFVNGKHLEAAETYYDFPEAHVMLIFRVYSKDPDRQADMLKELSPKMANHVRILTSKAIWLMQYEKYDEAIATIQQIINIRPNIELLRLLGEIFELQGKHKDAISVYLRRIDMHPNTWAESNDCILRNAAKMMTRDEEEKHAAREKILKEIEQSEKIVLKHPNDAVSST